MSAAMALAVNLRAMMVEQGLSPEALARDCSLELGRVQAALFGEGVSTGGRNRPAGRVSGSVP
jgi:hypothetical protein